MRAPLAALALAALLASPAVAHAQVARPWFGIGLALPEETVLPPGLGGVGSQRPSSAEPISLGYLFRVHARIGPRLLVHIDASAFHWFASENFAFPRGLSAALQTQAVFVPFDAGVRFNVLPVLGPHQLLVGLGVRAMYAPWLETVGSSVSGRGAGFGAGGFAEVAYEVLFARRLGIEFAARYAIVDMPQALGTASGRFDQPLAVSTLSLSVGANYYF